MAIKAKKVVVGDEVVKLPENKPRAQKPESKSKEETTLTTVDFIIKSSSKFHRDMID